MPHERGEKEIKALILSCNTGEGHNSVAKAIKECFDAAGEQCDIVDSLALIHEKVSDFLSKGHVFMYRHVPVLFKKGYARAEEHEERFAEGSFTYELMASGAQRLYKLINDEGYDTVICPHVFPGLMVTEVIRNYDAKFISCFVDTDYTVSPGTAETRLDKYFLPDESVIRDAEDVDMERTVISGIPVRQEFFHTADKSGAKRALGIPEGAKHILMMCGSMGCGPIKRLAQGLAEAMGEKQFLTVVCGTNQRLENRLENRVEEKKNVRILGYADNIPALMDSADLYLTKPGGISVSEAAAKALPMVLVDAVAGCEEYNLNYAVDKGIAKTADGVEELINLTMGLISDDEELDKMHAAALSLSDRNGGRIVYDCLKQMERENKKKDENDPS